MGVKWFSKLVKGRSDPSQSKAPPLLDLVKPAKEAPSIGKPAAAPPAAPAIKPQASAQSAQMPANHAQVLADAAKSTQERGDIEEANRIWREYRASFPSDPTGYVKGGNLLRVAKRYDEADLLLTEGLGKCSDLLALSIDFAWVAHYRGNWPEALARWEAVAAKFPQHPAGLTGVGRVLLQLWRLEEAEHRLSNAAISFPADIHVATTFAQVASAREDWEESMRRWDIVCGMKPDDLVGITAACRVLLKLSRLDEAEKRLSTAVKLFPADFNIATLSAEAAVAREDWREAVRRWDVVCAMNPSAKAAQERRGIAKWQLGLELGEKEKAAAKSGEPMEGVPVDIERVQDAASRALVMKFESLGENCEFGLVQRHYEAEPLGLLRWTYCGPDMLIRLLAGQFSGLGEIDHLTLSRSAGKEYFLKDKAYGITFHTFLSTDVADEPAFLRKHAMRLRWLRDKMIADLKEGGKTFVYKVHHGATDAQVGQMLARLREYGPHKLLCVSLASEQHPPGSVINAGNGLMRGYLSRLNPKQGTNTWEIPYEEWVSICRAADAL